MYSHCKCRGCIQALSEEKEVLCGQHTTDIDKKHRKRFVPVPQIEDITWPRGDMKFLFEF